jgi:SAM-dependent methyltransferase
MNMERPDASLIGEIFDRQWSLYQRAIRANILCHREMFATLDAFLSQHFSDRPFRFADLGCGDSSAVLNTLRHKPITHYIGVDLAEDLIAKSALTLQALPCEKTFLNENMETAITHLSASVDVILCAFSSHHLTQDAKAQFIRNCYEALHSPGYLILMDGVATDQETREEWLGRLENRFRTMVPDFTPADVAEIMQHPRDYDYPETIARFRSFAQHSPWRSFDVLFEQDNFLAFLLFTK